MSEKMLAAVFKRPREVEIERVEVPEPKPDEVLVRVLYNGICGTDLRVWEGTHWMVEGWPLEPGAYGHESVGEVASVGSRVEGLKAGDKVVGFGGKSFAQYSLAKDPILVADSALERLALVSPLSNALNIASLVGPRPGGKVLVMGQGTIGLFVTKLLSERGVEVIATDVVDRRLRLSKKFGAKAYDARDPEYAAKIVEENGEIESVVECAGSERTLAPACDVVAPAGTIVIYGCQQTMPLPYKPLRRKGVRIEFGTASTNPRTGIDYTLLAVRMLQRDSLYAEDVISEKITLQELPEVLAGFDRERWIKVVVEPNRE
ncbi:MAG: zinc-binding dehydrogenase [Candidatus Brockarchaeota archaeon]|nr:zinc-binding dehydrogenase [Candidatus Brockarchaeota archaeon]